jgi:hypothetical protein
MRFRAGKEKSRFSLAHHKDEFVELVQKTDHKTLAIWAVDCVERVMPYLGKISRRPSPQTRPRNTPDMDKHRGV